MQRLIWTVIAAFALATLIEPFGLKWLRKLKLGQTIYDLGPESHKVKQGTPTMGGILFAPAALIAALIFAKGDSRFDFLLIALVCMVGFGLIGFVDDFIKVKLKRSLGLTPKQKLAPQILLSIGIAFWAYFNPQIGSKLVVPFFNVEWNLGWAYIPVMVFILVGTVNSANLLDGLDGLLGGCSMIDFAFMAVVCGILAVQNPANASNFTNSAVLCCAMTGALLAFLRINSHPAKVFMGDVGSFVIGGALVGVMLVTRLSLYLPIVALAMFLSSLSDIIQTTWFKYTRKKYGTPRRVFKMAPLHHHFELSGMAETHVTAMYYIGTILLCLVALFGFIA